MFVFLYYQQDFKRLNPNNKPLYTPCFRIISKQ